MKKNNEIYGIFRVWIGCILRGSIRFTIWKHECLRHFKFIEDYIILTFP